MKSFLVNDYEQEKKRIEKDNLDKVINILDGKIHRSDEDLDVLIKFIKNTKGI